MIQNERIRLQIRKIGATLDVYIRSSQSFSPHGFHGFSIIYFNEVEKETSGRSTVPPMLRAYSLYSLEFMTGVVHEALLHSKERPSQKLSRKKGSALRETLVSFLLRYLEFYKRNRITSFIVLIGILKFFYRHDVYLIT